jgi:hypothetical protein
MRVNLFAPPAPQAKARCTCFIPAVSTPDEIGATAGEPAAPAVGWLHEVAKAEQGYAAARQAICLPSIKVAGMGGLPRGTCVKVEMGD